MWETIVPSFEGFQTITYDLFCHGQNPYVGSVCSMHEMAEDVIKFLQENKIENPTIIGHSMGGYVGLEILKRIQGKLILLHSNFWEDPEQKKHDRNRVIEIVRSNKNLFISEAIPGLFDPKNQAKCSSHIAQLIEKAKKMDSSQIEAATAGMRDRMDNTAMLGNAEISIIHGENDPIIPTSVLNENLKKAASKPERIDITNVGHMSIWEDSASLIKAIKELLN